jgi:hypothetical protein
VAVGSGGGSWHEHGAPKPISTVCVMLLSTTASVRSARNRPRSPRATCERQPLALAPAAADLETLGHRSRTAHPNASRSTAERGTTSVNRAPPLTTSPDFADSWRKRVARALLLRPGAPLAIGLWGGFDYEGWMPARNYLPSRFFSLRSHERAREMLARHGTLEHFTTWPDDRSDWEHQLAILRSGDGRASE